MEGWYELSEEPPNEICVSADKVLNHGEREARDGTRVGSFRVGGGGGESRDGHDVWDLFGLDVVGDREDGFRVEEAKERVEGGHEAERRHVQEKMKVSSSRRGRDERRGGMRFDDNSRSVAFLSSFRDLLVPEGTSDGNELVQVHETRLEGDHGFDGGEVGERVVGDGEVSNGGNELGESFQRVGVGEFVVFVGDGDDLK